MVFKACFHQAGVPTSKFADARSHQDRVPRLIDIHRDPQYSGRHYENQTAGGQSTAALICR